MRRLLTRRAGGGRGGGAGRVSPQHRAALTLGARRDPRSSLHSLPPFPPSRGIQGRLPGCGSAAGNYSSHGAPRAAGAATSPARWGEGTMRGRGSGGAWPAARPLLPPGPCVGSGSRRRHLAPRRRRAAALGPARRAPPGLGSAAAPGSGGCGLWAAGAVAGEEEEEGGGGGFPAPREASAAVGESAARPRGRWLRLPGGGEAAAAMGAPVRRG